MEQTTDLGTYSGGKFPYFSRPKLIGYFSVGAQRNYTNDICQLKYINKIPAGKVDFDLNHNISSALINTTDGEKIKFFLEYFKDHKADLNVFDQSDISLEDVPFMCFRGLLKDMCELPYANQESFRFSACLFRGVIYVHHLTTTEDEARKDNITERERTMMSWGYKFEQYIVADDPSRDPDIEPPVDESLKFSIVFESQLNQHRLFYGAEMDGALVEGSSLREDFPSAELSEEQVLTELRKLQFIELKTSKQIEERRHDIIFRRHKIRSWWLQSFLAGIETIVCGFRNDDGIVKEVKTFDLYDLPHLGKDYWCSSICMNFCDELLWYIKKCFEREIVHRFGSCGNNVRTLPLLELVFERMPWSNVRLGQPFPNEDISVLDDWYIKMFPEL